MRTNFNSLSLFPPTSTHIKIHKPDVSKAIPPAEWQLCAMAPSYYSTPHSPHDHFVATPPALLDRVLAVPGGLATPLQRLWERHGYSYSSVSTHPARSPRPWRNAARRNWTLRRLLNLPHLLVVVWALVLLWGERWAFQRSIRACEWATWERWVSSVLSCPAPEESAALEGAGS